MSNYGSIKLLGYNHDNCKTLRRPALLAILTRTGEYGLRDQIRRAAVSVMSNIAEGFNAGSDSEFIRFLSFSRRSVSETQSQSYIALDQKYITQDRFDHIYSKANEIERQVNALIGYLHKSRSHYSAKDGQVTYSLNLPTDLSNL